MYGIVNKAIQDLIISNFGEQKWNEIRNKSGINQDYFISGQSYDDDVTYKLANTTAKELNTTIDEVLTTFGEWWVLKTTQEKYQGLMESGGTSLKDFLINLPLFHNRVMLIYPNLTPPEFKVSDISEKSLNLHYFSVREGLQAFVKGLIQGLSISFKTPVKIKVIKSRNKGDTHEIFNISW
ncbi:MULTISPECIES: heme NO-binding domain-containing protein [Flavobacterium]|uniref:Heme NO-binding protein n=2 Tax=Flavobacterium TaxID=237 RepID=A0AA94F5F4_9FLAO|nr:MULTISPECIES: heme NO-binding domain-containing protein [Flavobacterium]OXA83238.1 heme NO-binding protein [Flavobacterium columnare] [Flavobacterium columnare NBRC 100251 = ATCC 23463]AMA50580.1 heme NO-binding protein [Flavobacterium covae]MCH4829891.1 heme NO-binding domain-containing protein [Flavobacterium columnare]MCH4832729.1 heme NO-binding domain-containing protein [Flavobacterium columnare]MCJ1807754.1 heme NO-binding domain-containing protein [Flavobacterium covae]